MMKTNRFVLALVLLLTLCLAALPSCCETAVLSGLWENAVYTEDTELGTGSKTLIAEVTAQEKTVTFTIHTDSAVVGDALLEQGLIAGEEGMYGLYVKVVNGMTADYDIDQSYWAFFINGEYATVGVDWADIDEGAVYQLVYTR